MKCVTVYWALVQFRTEPMTDGIKRCWCGAINMVWSWCMHSTSRWCVRLGPCALFLFFYSVSHSGRDAHPPREGARRACDFVNGKTATQFGGFWLHIKPKNKALLSWPLLIHFMTYESILTTDGSIRICISYVRCTVAAGRRDLEEFHRISAGKYSICQIFDINRDFSVTYDRCT